MADAVIIVQQRRKRPHCLLRAMVNPADVLYTTAHLLRSSLSMLFTVQLMLPHAPHTSSMPFLSFAGQLFYSHAQLCIADTPALHFTLRLRLATLLRLH